MGEVVEVIDGLYAGPGCVDLDEDGIKVDYVVTLEPSCPAEASGAQRLTFPLIDMEAEPIENAVGAIEAIAKALTRGRRVYVHCYAGCGRTGMVVSGYLVLFRDMTAEEAVNHFVSLRGCGPESEEQLLFLDLLEAMKRRLKDPWKVIEELEGSEGIGDALSRLYMF